MNDDRFSAQDTDPLGPLPGDPVPPSGAGEAEPEERNVTLKPGVWNKAAIVSALVRSAYSQDEMEAINNNRLAVLADLMEGLRTEGLVGAIKVIVNQSAEAKAEYETMQKWRATAKRWAAELLTQYPEVC